MNDTDSGATPPGEHASEASGERQGEERPGVAGPDQPTRRDIKPTHLDDPPAVGLPPIARGVPGRRQAQLLEGTDQQGQGIFS